MVVTNAKPQWVLLMVAEDVINNLIDFYIVCIALWLYALCQPIAFTALHTVLRVYVK